MNTKEKEITLKSLMVQGTTSDAGKSIITAGLCRSLKRRGVSVAPFKPQNMALNSAVTVCGGEIGRAQALQAAACGLEPEVDFNPVLLKPSSDRQSQVIINGQVVDDLDAMKFGSLKALAFPTVKESYYRLQEKYDVVLIEGAGSPAEINLRKNDIANMGFAESVDCPVILVGDINLGGVFAHLTGTLNLLSKTEQERIKGFVINKFRGDVGLLQGGLDWLEQYSNKPILGVIPYLPNLKLDAEDAIEQQQKNTAAKISIKIPVLKRISNHTDFDPLRWHKDIDLTFIGEGESLEGADLIVLPGSKNVREDLNFLYQQGWDHQIKRHLRYGGKLLGICGGFQMLGNQISDLHGIEGKVGTTDALGLLDFQTQLTHRKQLKQVKGWFKIGTHSSTISGYEIHCGVSEGAALTHSFADLTDQHNATYKEGAQSEEGQIIGTYIHGLFEDKHCLEGLLQWICGKKLEATDWNKVRDSELNRLADELEMSLGMDQIDRVIESTQKRKTI